MEHLTCAPDATEEGVGNEHEGPPVAPEQVQAKIVGAVLRPKQQQRHERRIHVGCEPEVDGLRPQLAAEQALQQRQRPQEIPPEPVLCLQKNARSTCSLNLVQL